MVHRTSHLLRQSLSILQSMRHSAYYLTSLIVSLNFVYTAKFSLISLKCKPQVLNI